MARRMNREVRELIEWAEQNGWHVERLTGKSHVFMRHENGSTCTFASTPSKYRSLKNARANLEREMKRGR